MHLIQLLRTVCEIGVLFSEYGGYMWNTIFDRSFSNIFTFCTVGTKGIAIVEINDKPTANVFLLGLKKIHKYDNYPCTMFINFDSFKRILEREGEGIIIFDDVVLSDENEFVRILNSRWDWLLNLDRKIIFILSTSVVSKIIAFSASVWTSIALFERFVGEPVYPFNPICVLLNHNIVDKMKLSNSICILSDFFHQHEKSKFDDLCCKLLHSEKTYEYLESFIPFLEAQSFVDYPELKNSINNDLGIIYLLLEDYHKAENYLFKEMSILDNYYNYVIEYNRCLLLCLMECQSSSIEELQKFGMGKPTCSIEAKIRILYAYLILLQGDAYLAKGILNNVQISTLDAPQNDEILFERDYVLSLAYIYLDKCSEARSCLTGMLEYSVVKSDSKKQAHVMALLEDVQSYLEAIKP